VAERIEVLCGGDSSGNVVFNGEKGFDAALCKLHWPLVCQTGQMPYNMMAASSSGHPSTGNCLTVEQLQLMSQLAHQQQPRPVYQPLEAVLSQAQMIGGYMPPQAAAPMSVNSTVLQPQPLTRGWYCCSKVVLVTAIYIFITSVAALLERLDRFSGLSYNSFLNFLVVLPSLFCLIAIVSFIARNS